MMSGRRTSRHEYDMMRTMDLYHVINRGVDGRKIFMDLQDYARFVHDLYEFNDIAPAQEFLGTGTHKTSGRTTSRRRDKLIDIHGWTLMKNHFHLLISEFVDGGITLFLRKLSGYARYFNERHGRRGTLFQGRTKKILVDREAHFLYVLNYLHANPLDYLQGAKRWRERDKGAISDIKKALAYLEKYRWSSYLDYIGTPNFQSILTKTLYGEVFEDYASEFNEFLRDRSCDNIDVLTSFEY